jgi:p-methyltransferase
MKVGLIGHIVPAPLALIPTKMESWGYKYTRVEMGDGSMIDHIAHLKSQLGIPRNESFSVWEMSLASVLLLQSRLKESGNEVLTVNYIDSDNEDREFARIKEFAPDILALSTTFILSPSQLNYVARLIRKHLPDTFVVAGGQHIWTELAHLNDKQQRAYLKATKLDGFINAAQGEASLVKLSRLHPARLAEVPNLLWRRPSEEIVINPRQAEANDLNAAIGLSGIREGSVVHLRTARGCAFHCSFCSYPASGGTWTLANVESAIAQLRLAKEAGAGAVIFTDDTFNVPKERFQDLLDQMIQAGVNLPWYSFLRCQFVDADLVEKMRRSGCRGVLLGIESGADSVLSNMNKGAKVEYYRRGVQWLKNAGITSVGSFLIGFPGETAETIAQTEEFISNAGLDFFYLQLFYYLHHAPVHQAASKFGLTGGGLLWSHATMDWQEASDRLDQIFRKLGGSRCLHQDYNLWEVAFLENRGFDRGRIAQYRAMINRMTLATLDSSPAPSENPAEKHQC